MTVHTVWKRVKFKIDRKRFVYTGSVAWSGNVNNVEVPLPPCTMTRDKTDLLIFINISRIHIFVYH